MRVEKIKKLEARGGNRIESRIRFEQGQGKPLNVYVQTDEYNTLSSDGNGFLLACYLPAWFGGEKRVMVEGELCPRLVANLKVVSSVFRHWFKDLGTPPVIEGDFSYRTPASRAAMFLSGGVDSTFTLMDLTDKLPANHPDRPHSAVLIDYQQLKALSDEETSARFHQRKSAILKTCSERGVGFTPIHTNLRLLNADGNFWTRRYHGAFMAGIAHFLGEDYNQFYISASIHAGNFEGKALAQPWGSHALTDHLYSSFHTKINHYGFETSRLEKTGAISDWPAALDNIQVCVSKTSRGLNCGTCKKCIRTKLYLLHYGKLAESRAFRENDVTADEVLGIKVTNEVVYSFFVRLKDKVRNSGRPDLAEALDVITRKYARFRSINKVLRRLRGVY